MGLTYNCMSCKTPIEGFALWVGGDAEGAYPYHSECIEIPHSEYPHHPGTLYDCWACESECFCYRTGGIDIKCLFCELNK